MKSAFIIIFALVYICTFVYSASIFDYLSTGDDAEARGDEENKKTCLCTGPTCICCVDFNMSLIDLGGPGCVRMKYLGADEGVALNVSYGDSLLHSDTVKAAAEPPTPTCLNIFSKLAQMCAVFTELVKVEDGLKGCVKLEPMLLQEVQLELPIGCFNMNSDGIKQIEEPKANNEEKAPTPTEEAPLESAANETAPDETDTTALLEGITAADILSAVSETADSGIAMISKWLGIKLAPEGTKNVTNVDK